MRGKSSSRVKSMEAAKEEPQLSGAYIRSLVKHLSSSTRPKDQILNPNSPNSGIENRLDEPQQLQSPPPPPQQPKKQVRRRLHTSRPYQERLLNMAEARREIVTALKLHRASMKQQQKEEAPPPIPNLDPNPNPNMYQVPNPSSFSSFAYPTLSWFYPTLAPLPDIPENYNLALPNQPLGLNLNFQGFNNIDTPLYTGDINNKDVTTINQPPSPHSSSSSYSYSGVFDASVEHGDTKMHLAMDEKEMEEIRSIGEKHDIEWNDSVNFATSAWWSKFLDSMEVDAMEDGLGGDVNNSSRLLMQHDLGDYYFQDASSLPCLDIGEIEWADGDWLS